MCTASFSEETVSLWEATLLGEHGNEGIGGGKAGQWPVSETRREYARVAEYNGFRLHDCRSCRWDELGLVHAPIMPCVGTALTSHLSHS